MKSPLVLLCSVLGLMVLGVNSVQAMPLSHAGVARQPMSTSADVSRAVTSVAAVDNTSARVPGRPTGEALVRLDGGTAYTRKPGRHSYKLLLPAGASITWLGEVRGKGLRAGTFSRKGLVAGWTGLGHRAGVGVVSTLTWGHDSALALVSDPRVNADGWLVFKANTRERLPKKLPSFSLNITRATKATRDQGYPDYFDPLALSSSMRVQVSAGGDYSASVAFQQLDSSGSWVNCVSSTNSGEHPINPNPYNFPGGRKYYSWGPTTCGGVSFLYSAAGPGGTYYNSLTWAGTSSGGYTYGKILGEFALAGNFTFEGILAQWAYGTGGSPACPINGSTCP